MAASTEAVTTVASRKAARRSINRAPATALHGRTGKAAVFMTISSTRWRLVCRLGVQDVVPLRMPLDRLMTKR
jgi:hypothetical protein